MFVRNEGKEVSCAVVVWLGNIGYIGYFDILNEDFDNRALLRNAAVWVGREKIPIAPQFLDGICLDVVYSSALVP